MYINSTIITHNPHIISIIFRDNYNTEVFMYEQTATITTTNKK